MHDMKLCIFAFKEAASFGDAESGSYVCAHKAASARQSSFGRAPSGAFDFCSSYKKNSVSST